MCTETEGNGSSREQKEDWIRRPSLFLSLSPRRCMRIVNNISRDNIPRGNVQISFLSYMIVAQFQTTKIRLILWIWSVLDLKMFKVLIYKRGARLEDQFINYMNSFSRLV